MVWPALIAAGGALAGGVIGSHSAQSTNRKQIALAREQMRFQERMSNTAYTRATKDLERAGLNRILALGSPASSPGGAQPPSLKVPGEYIQRGISSAAQNAAVAAQIALTQAQTEKVRKEGDILAPEATIKKEAGELLDYIIVNVKKRGPAIMETAKDVANASQYIPGKISEQLGKLNLGNSGKTVKPEQSQLTLLEQTFNPKQNEVQNVAAWAAAYKRKNGRNANEEQLRRVAAEIRNQLRHQR